MNKELKQAIIKELKEIEYMDWELSPLFEVIYNNENEKLQEKIVEFLNENYLSSEEMEEYFIKHNSTSIERLRFALGDADYGCPIMINTYGNLEKDTSDNVISQVIDIIENWDGE